MNLKRLSGKVFLLHLAKNIPEAESISFFTGLLSDAYGETLSDNESLYNAGFRIMPSDASLLPHGQRNSLQTTDHQYWTSDIC